MLIELVPLIELPTFKFPHLDEIDDIERKNQLLIEHNYSSVKKQQAVNQHQYKLSEISLADFKRAIDLHISDLPITASCAFFGGYGLRINSAFVLFPQCCGLLSEINDWKKILNENFKPFYLNECHPSPHFEKMDNDVIISCDDIYETFSPNTASIISVDYQSLAAAVINVCSELERVSKQLDTLNTLYKTHSISDYLIWGK